MSDNELDAELLELAGDLDGGDDGIDNLDGSAAHTRSPTPLADVDDVEDKSPTSSQPRRGVAQKRKSSAARGTARRRRADDSEDEGEA